MRIKFLQDFQGRETKNIFYKNNEVVDLDAETAELLVREKRAVLFVEPIEIRQPVIEVVEDSKTSLTQKDFEKAAEVLNAVKLNPEKVEVFEVSKPTKRGKK